MKLQPQVFVSPTKPESHLITPVEDELFWKPRGGMWTSTWDDEGGDWVRWLNEQDYSLDDPRWGGKLWLLEPTEANIFVVGHPEGYNELADRFPHPAAKPLGLRSMEKMVYWPDVAKHFDAIHVPNPWAHRWLLEEQYYAASLFFNTCDAESTCWFNWCFEGEPAIVEVARV